MVRHYIWLILLSGFAIWQASSIQSWPLGWQSLLFYAPYAVAGIGAFISVFLNRMQAVLLLVSVSIVVLALSYFVPTQLTDPSMQVVFPLLSVLLPLNLLLWVLVPEKGVKHNVYNLLLLGGFAAQAAGIYWVMQNMPVEFVTHLTTPVSIDPTFPIKVPMVGSVVILLVANILVIRLAMMHKAKVLDVVVLFVLVLMAYGLNQPGEYGVLEWMATISGLMIMLSLVFDAHKIAYTDELTGMAGRRALFESFMGLTRKYTVVMIDIDHFKKFNDTYGHDIGDLVLRTVSRVLNGVGSGGKAFRFGGEEFTVLFVGKTPEQVRPVMDALRKEVEQTNLSFKHNGKETSTKVTVSMGVAQKTKEMKTPEEVIKAADQALYQAKELGRNRVVVAGDPSEQALKKGQKSARIRKRNTKSA
ncbi:GGDEF domain-containing protein [Thiomicrorhabdus sp. ZW0627]|uniref:GGDEF domain-containing protein n=1 Tax=Thiomicrorhabdus sp. ZW0627 TaxID=3039774 RepID=UPI002436E2B3|nr:GGDEF domain-containing protein [Thiomicrorhabdus sp. ZW0627]MDG6772824.1 GGDEF domain-containing protein [Thiomicrorhabdus sp. ZW0627]